MSISKWRISVRLFASAGRWEIWLRPGTVLAGWAMMDFFLAAVVVVWRLAVQDASVAILDVVVKSSQTGVRFAGIFGFDDFERVVG